VKTVIMPVVECHNAGATVTLWHAEGHDLMDAADKLDMKPRQPVPSDYGVFVAIRRSPFTCRAWSAVLNGKLHELYPPDDEEIREQIPDDEEMAFQGRPSTTQYRVPPPRADFEDTGMYSVETMNSTSTLWHLFVALDVGSALDVDTLLKRHAHCMIDKSEDETNTDAVYVRDLFSKTCVRLGDHMNSRVSDLGFVAIEFHYRVRSLEIASSSETTTPPAPANGIPETLESPHDLQCIRKQNSSFDSLHAARAYATKTEAKCRNVTLIDKGWNCARKKLNYYLRCGYLREGGTNPCQYTVRIHRAPNEDGTDRYDVMFAPKNEHVHSKECQEDHVIVEANDGEEGLFENAPSYLTWTEEIVKQANMLLSIQGMSENMVAQILSQSYGQKVTDDVVRGFCRSVKCTAPRINAKVDKGKQAQSILGAINAEKERNHEFSSAVQLDSEMRLQSVFWTFSMAKFRQNNMVLLIDATYKTNALDMPLVNFTSVDRNGDSFLVASALLTDEKYTSYKWLLEEFSSATGDDLRPIVVFTDEDQALSKAVNEVWPDTVHQLCWWHIVCNMQKNMGKTILNHQASAMLLRMPHHSDRFEEEWQAFVSLLKTRNATPDQLKYVDALYEKRHKWSSQNKTFTCGILSTQRVERTHRSVKALGLKSSTSLLGVWTATKELYNRQVNRAISRPVPPALEKVTTTWKTMASPWAVQKTASEYAASLSYSVSGNSTDWEVRPSQTEVGVLVSVRHVREIVSTEELEALRQMGHASPWSCSCGDDTRAGLPCRHILRVLTIIQRPVTEDMFHPFWRKTTWGTSIRSASTHAIVNSATSPSAPPRQKTEAALAELKRLSFRLNNLLSACNDEHAQTMSLIQCVKQLHTVELAREREVAMYTPGTILDPIAVQARGAGTSRVGISARKRPTAAVQETAVSTSVENNNTAVSDNAILDGDSGQEAIAPSRAKQRRTCKACGQVGHQSNNAKCPVKSART
jgi:hypothetical protein